MRLCQLCQLPDVRHSCCLFMPLFLYYSYDPNSHKITSSLISSTRARIKRTPPPITGQRGAALRILRHAQARLAAAEAATAAASAATPPAPLIPPL
jgi:hypothetical protein